MLKRIIKTLIRKPLNELGLEIVSTSRIGMCPFRDAARLFQARDIKVNVVFDVGANVGHTTRELMNILHPTHVYCFEPFSKTYSTLVANVGSLNRVTCEAFGFSDARESVRCCVRENSELNSPSPSLNANPNDGPTEVIQLMTLDDYCQERTIEQICLLKTDTEGFDLKVLRGASQLLARRGIDCIVSEVGFQTTDSRHTSFVDTSRFLSEFGYRLVSLCGQHTAQSGLHLEYCNAVFISPDVP